MKTKCPNCGAGKARRLCARAGHVEICSACCASLRDEDCGECVHYAASLQYEETRGSSAAGLSGQHFMMELNDEVQEIVNEALENAQRGRLQSATDTLTALLPDHPRHHDVPYGIGVVHALKGEYEESVAWFDRAIRIYSHSIEAHYNKAVSYQKLLDLPNCIRAYQKVVAIGPASDPEVAKARSFVEDAASSIRRNEGVSLDAYLRAADKFNEAFKKMEAGDWRGAVNGFRASASIHDRSAPCHGNMGLCLAQLGHKAEALAELDRAIEINPGYQPAISNRRLVEAMTEGKPLESAGFESVDFSKESFLKKKQ